MEYTLYERGKLKRGEHKQTYHSTVDISKSNTRWYTHVEYSKPGSFLNKKDNKNKYET